MATAVPVTVVIAEIKGRASSKVRLFTIDSILVLWWNWDRAMAISALNRAVVATVSVACIMMVVKVGAEVVSVTIGSVLVLSWNWTIAATVPAVVVVVEMGDSRSVLVVIISVGASAGAGAGGGAGAGRVVTRVAGRRMVILVRSASTSTAFSFYWTIFFSF